MSNQVGIQTRVPDDAREGVVLLHGIGRTYRSMTRLARACQAAHFATLNVDYPSRKGPIDQHIHALHRAVIPFATRFERIHFIGFSMGGLLARAYLASYRPENLGRVLLIGAPLGGSEVADTLCRTRGVEKLFNRWMGPALGELTTARRAACTLAPPDYPVAMIAGATGIFGPWGRLFNRPHDGLVAVESTRCSELDGHIILPFSHAGLLWRPEVARAAVSYLTRGTL